MPFHDDPYRRRARAGIRRAGPARRAAPIALVATLALAAALAGCGATSTGVNGEGSGGPVSGGPAAIRVVASTNVWGDVAQAVGAGHVDVISLINDASQDPHEFEPSSRDELAVSRADVVIANGGGYDDFLGRMIDTLGARPVVVTATDAAAHVPSVSPDNEHLWFDLDAVAAVADAIAHAYASADPAHASDFQSAAREFDTSLQPVRDRIAAVRAEHEGAPVAITEPLPMYLIEAAGLRNVTPAAFSEAVEEGIDVSPAELSDTLALVTERRAALLVYNDQSVSGQTEQVLAAARDSGVPVLPVAETLPEGQHYQKWMSGIVTALAADLDGKAES